ncbi:MAG TPA: DUF4236 domain-containing protein [Rhizomicrobium sp.]|jgi:hypothetical protein
MGFRFQKRISILPGVRINLSKSGVSTSLGPRGADVNIGKDGVTANAGLPGTGLSYRQKLGGASAGAGATNKKAGKGGWLAVLLVIGGLGVWAFQHLGKVEKTLAPVRAPVSSTVLSTGLPTGLSPKASTGVSATSLPATSANDNMQRFVHREGAILREEPRASGHILRKESKGAAVALVSQSDDGWSQVRDGDVTGWMRSGVLGTEPPR